MPSARAFCVIILAKASSLPPRYSAMTTAASLADRVTMPLIASSTVMVCPGLSPSMVGNGKWRIELEPAGVETFEQQVERHHFCQRGGVAQRVGIRRLQHRAAV